MIKSKRFTGVYRNTMKSGDTSYYFTYLIDTKKIWVKVGTKSNRITEVYANQKRIETLNALRLGEDSPMKKNIKNITFEEGYNDYIKWAENNKKSCTREKQIFYLHLYTLKNKEIKALKRKDFEHIRNNKLKTLAPRTVEYILAVARQIINHCIDDELVKNYLNPIRKSHAQGKSIIPKYNNQKLAYLSYQQAKEILEKLKSTHVTSYYFSVLMLFTGARFDEIANLTWLDIDLSSQLIHIHPSKNGDARKVFITELIAEVLKDLMKSKIKEQSPVIPNSLGKRWDRVPKQFQIVVDKLYPDNKEAGKYRITPHTLRHTHASWLAKNGTDILRIKEQLGHKKLDMTLRYAHLIPSQRHDKTIELYNDFVK